MSPKNERVVGLAILYKSYDSFSKNERVQIKMEKIKGFVINHKEELALGVGAYLIYRAGFKAGRRSYLKAMQRTIQYMKDAGYVIVRVAEGK